MKKVKSILRATPHAIAYCRDCDWNSGANGKMEIADMRNALFKHLRQNNHNEGGIETGMVSHYKLFIE